MVAHRRAVPAPDPWQEVCSCDACGGGSFATAGWLRDVHGGERFRLQRCRACELVFVNPRPSKAAIHRHYPDAYQPYAQRPRRASRWHALATDRRGRSPVVRAALRVRETASTFVIPERTGRERILDIGCSSGAFLDVMRDLGWNTHGVELSNDMARHARARGHDVRCGDAESRLFREQQFDVVYLAHSLEHTHSPREALLRAREYLRPGGSLYLGVPNHGGLQRRIWGTYWSGAEVPRHLYFFTRRTLTELLERTGFRDVRVTTRTGANSWLRAIRLWANDVLGTDWQREPKTIERLLEVPTAIAGLLCFAGLGNELRATARR